MYIGTLNVIEGLAGVRRRHTNYSPSMQGRRSQVFIPTVPDHTYTPV